MAQLQPGHFVLMINGVKTTAVEFAATYSNALNRDPPTTLPETITLTGELVMSEADRDTFDVWAEEQRDAELKRLKALAAMSGLPVLYDTRMFGLDWSPVYDADGPSGWVHNTTNEWRTGAIYPGDDL